MIINPQRLIDQGYVTLPTQDEQLVQPNGLDITLDRVFTVEDQSPFHIGSDKWMRDTAELPKKYDHKTDMYFWKFDPRKCYDCVSNMYVELPNGVAAVLFPRSTFNRNGIFLTSGLYDQGFCGSFGFMLHNNSGPAFIADQTRVGQVVFLRSEDSGLLYQGKYNTDAGEHWSEAE